MLLSVIVCTYNRAELLERCLRSLSRQSAAADEYEIVVIDNNSSDHTPRVVSSYSRADCSVRYFREEKQGLSIARNRGYSEAVGEYVAYIDDDALADGRWVENIRAFALKNPEVEIFGGPYAGYTLTDPPAWYKPSYESWSLGDAELPIGANEWLSGNNIVFRKDTLVRLGGFDERLGMIGGRTYYGEETKLQHILKLEGKPIYYVPGITIQHLVAKYKMDMVWMLKASYANGCASFLTFSLQRRPVRQIGYAIFLLLKGLLQFAFGKESRIQCRFYESFSPFLWHIGLFIGMVRS